MKQLLDGSASVTFRIPALKERLYGSFTTDSSGIDGIALGRIAIVKLPWVNALTGEVEALPRAARQMSDYPTSMISLCQEGKSSPDALRRSAGTNPF